MSFKFHRENKQVVKFVEENKDSAVRRSNPSEKESMKNPHEGPFFPNLQAMFKNKQQEPSDISEEKISSKTSSNTTAREEEDINMEATEFIKRKHHSLYLQKLMSMAAAAQPS
ncbi:hypothetical protein IEQ34_003938 [Dendrobium chrysotoxum]|uniref:Uncharacterized protein n=1 Tax=Dendrobium chrysotoxum TaxID=161865 RepID=A0AAV7HH04_DENCH|nr:hypothetical protein IEQ34_003938 [Dendrobium chrysotoxum]